MKKLISILLIAMILFAGCTSLDIADENIVKDVSDIITDTVFNGAGNEKAERKESHTVKSENKNTLNLMSSVGDINIVPHQSDDTIININITAKAKEKKKAEEIIENYIYKINEEGSSIVIDTTFNELPKDINLVTDLTVYLPSTIQYLEVAANVGDVNINSFIGNMDIKSNVGEVVLDKSNGSYTIKADVGGIILKDCTAVGNSEFITSTGEIELTFKSISKAVSIIAETGVGNIEFSLNDDSGYHAVINEFMKDERIQTKHDQGTSINLTTGVGKIEFNWFY